MKASIRRKFTGRNRHAYMKFALVCFLQENMKAHVFYFSFYQEVFTKFVIKI